MIAMAVRSCWRGIVMAWMRKGEVARVKVFSRVDRFPLTNSRASPKGEISLQTLCDRPFSILGPLPYQFLSA